MLSPYIIKNKQHPITHDPTHREQFSPVSIGKVVVLTSIESHNLTASDKKCIFCFCLFCFACMFQQKKVRDTLEQFQLA